MPPIGLLLGNVDFSNLFVVIREGQVSGVYETLAAAKAAGAVTINYGLFINTIISFLIVAFAVFMLIRSVNKINGKRRRRKQTPKSARTVYQLFQLKHPAVHIASLKSREHKIKLNYAPVSLIVPSEDYPTQ